GLTLALAESCTGGAISAHLVETAGASEYFLGSIVVYSNHLKTKVLGADLIHGAVSHECAQSLILKTLELTDASIAGAVTGIAGPLGGSEEKPVGTVFIGMGKKGEMPLVKECHFEGDRMAVIQKTKDYFLEELLFFLQSESY
ncbi:CinA family protein, partial [Chlamydiales bacterium]|nr:CinA family protein [Chlamydiales bacterium]